MQRVWAAESRESYTGCPVCANRCGCPGVWQGRGEAVSGFYGVAETRLAVWNNKLLCRAPVMVMGKYRGGGENNTFSKPEEKGTHLCLQVLSSPVLLTWLSRCSADVLLFFYV